MRIEVNVEKKYALMILASAVILAGAIGIYAYTVNPGNVPNPGHALASIQGYFDGDTNLEASLGKLCQKDGSNCDLGGAVNWTPVSQSKSFNFEGSNSLVLGSSVPQGAKEILINVNAYTLSSGGAPGYHCGQVYTQEGSARYKSFFCLYTSTSTPDSNSDTFWLPVTSTRTISWVGPVQSIGQNSVTFEVLGYR